MWLLFNVDCSCSYCLLEMLYLELSRVCPVFVVCHITVGMCQCVRSTVAKQLTAHPTVQVTFLQTNPTTLFRVESFPLSWYLYLEISDPIGYNMKFVLELISPTYRYRLKYEVFPAWRN